MPALQQRGLAYTDIQALGDIRDDVAGAKQAAQQFESLFISIMLESMRDANAVFAEGNLMSSSELDMHQQMLDQQWAIHVAQSGGIGLAPLIEAQLLRGRELPEAGAEPDAAATGNPAGAMDAARFAFRADGGADPGTPLRTVGFKAPAFGSREAFVAELLPELEAELSGTGFEPVRVLAQSVLETGWGQRLIHAPDGSSSNNLFGIKADGRWSGASVPVSTVEVLDGVVQRQVAHFRSYADVRHAVRDYVDFLSANPRYADVQAAGDDQSFAEALQASGYATDPGYARKLGDVLRSVRDILGI